MSSRTWAVLSRNRTPRHQVLECASPLALSNLVCGRKRGRGLPQSKTLARQPLPHPGSWSHCMRESDSGLSMSRNVGQASRLPPATKPTADFLSRSRQRAHGAGETPALRWSQSSHGAGETPPLLLAQRGSGAHAASRSEAVPVAVGLNPRLAVEQTHAVAERRLNDIMMAENSCVAPRRAAVYRSVVRGLKPAATLASSLREATPEIFGLRQSSAAFAFAGAAIEFSYQPVIANRKS